MDGTRTDPIHNEFLVDRKTHGQNTLNRLRTGAEHEPSVRWQQGEQTTIEISYWQFPGPSTGFPQPRNVGSATPSKAQDCFAVARGLSVASACVQGAVGP